MAQSITQDMAVQDLEKRKPEDIFEVHASDPTFASSEKVRLNAQGIVLRPHPSSSPLDPLNWPQWRKNCALFVVALYFFLFTFLTSVIVPSFTQLQEKLNITYEQVNYTVAVPALGLAVGHLIFSPVAEVYGRRIVMIVSCTIALVATIGSAVAKTYPTYMTARLIQGLGASPASTVGLMIINDIFFEHERGQKVGMWTLAVDVGTVIAPLPGGYVALISVDWPAWLTAILFSINLILMIFMLPESLYLRGEIADGDLADQKVSFISVRRLSAKRRFVPWAAVKAFLIMFKRLDVVIVLLYFGYCYYWWVIVVITVQPEAYPTFSVDAQGLLFLGLLVGTLLAEIFIAGKLSDKLIVWLAARNNGVRVPEQRLWLVYPASLLTFIGLTLWGWAVQRDYQWIVSQVGLAFIGAGIQQGNTMISSYMLDCYPDRAMDCVTFFTVVLNLSAFISPFFAAAWVEKSGFGWCFTAQAIITVVATLLVIPLLQLKGPSLRSRS